MVCHCVTCSSFSELTSGLWVSQGWCTPMFLFAVGDGCGCVSSVTHRSLPATSPSGLHVCSLWLLALLGRPFFFVSTGVRAVRWCGRCLSDLFCVRDAVLVDGRILSNAAKYAEWSVYSSHQLLLCRFMHGLRTICNHREWWPINNY